MWTLSKLSGDRDAAKAKLAELKDVPPHVKAVIAAEIDSLGTDVRSVIVDAYGQDFTDPKDLKSTRHMQITIRGIHA